jgi:hypothetical protein
MANIPAVNPTNTEGLQSRSFRTLTPAELKTAETLLDDTWYMLIGHKRIIFAALSVTDEHPVVDPILKRNVERLIYDAVKRVVDNPEALLEEQSDDYRYRRDVAVSSGKLYILQEDLDSLFEETSAAAFTITPSRRPEPLRPPLPEDDFYTPIR